MTGVLPAPSAAGGYRLKQNTADMLTSALKAQPQNKKDKPPFQADAAKRVNLK